MMSSEETTCCSIFDVHKPDSKLSLPKLPVEDDDIQTISCGTASLNILTKTGNVFTVNNVTKYSNSRNLSETTWKRPLGSTNISSPVIQIESGNSHNVALTADHKVLTWGKNDQCQMGRGKTWMKNHGKNNKTKEANGKIKDTFFNAGIVSQLTKKRILYVTCGDAHTMCLSDEGHVYTWGANDSGQLGVGSDSECCHDVQMVKHLENAHIIQVSAGGKHSFCLSTTGHVYCWGSNSFGQLGLDSDERKYKTPVRNEFFSDKNLKSISCGKNHTAFLTQDGRVFTCGQGDCEQLGNDRRQEELLPLQIADVSDQLVSFIASGRNYTLLWVESTNQLYIHYLAQKRTVELLVHPTNLKMSCGKDFFCIHQPLFDTSIHQYLLGYITPIKIHELRKKCKMLQIRTQLNLLSFRFVRYIQKIVRQKLYLRTELHLDDSRIRSLVVKRKNIINSARDLLSWNEENLRQQILIIFEGEVTQPGAGVMQEFFTVFFEQLFISDCNVFKADEQDQSCYSLKKGSRTEDLELVGLICGLAVYNNYTIDQDLPFAMYQQLLKKFSSTNLDASAEDAQFQCFQKGFFKGVPEELVRHFLPGELKVLLEGDATFDSTDLEEVTEYEGEYNKDHDVIRRFWKVFHKVDSDMQKKFLRFATGSERVPTYGWDDYKIMIKPRIEPGVDGNYLLISARTCFKHIYLPKYTTKEKMDERISMAADDCTGFGFD